MQVDTVAQLSCPVFNVEMALDMNNLEINSLAFI